MILLGALSQEQEQTMKRMVEERVQQAARLPTSHEAVKPFQKHTHCQGTRELMKQHFLIFVDLFGKILDEDRRSHFDLSHPFAFLLVQ